MPKNVDTNGSKSERLAVMRQLIMQAVNFFYPNADDDETVAKSINLQLFLLRVAWHEGRQLLTRLQEKSPGIPKGPGRSFFQFEPGKAKDGITYAAAKESGLGYLSKLAVISGHTKSELNDAADELKLYQPWPDGNLIEKLLGESDETNDLFAVYLTRLALARIPDELPFTVEGHADYWAKFWKAQFNDGDEEQQKQIFIAEANAIDSSLVDVSNLMTASLRQHAHFFEQLSKQLNEAATRLDAIKQLGSSSSENNTFPETMQ